MKRMDLTFLDGQDIPDLGRRILHSKGISDDIARILHAEMESGRTMWALLTIEIDDIPLVFWLPEQLEMVCGVFARKPFPTAKTLATESPTENRLNTHWLSELPKAVKAPKYRERFIKYVASSPDEKRKFYAFYGQGV